MEFVATLDNKISPGAKEATADLISLKKALDDVAAAMGKAGKPPPPIKGTDPKSSAAEKQIREGIANADKLAVATEKAAAKEAKAQTAADRIKAKAQAAKKKASNFGAGAKNAGSAVEVPLKFIAGAAGIAGLAGLTKMAIGYAGMAKLEAISYRLQVSFRQLFKGVDPAPLLRAFDKFTQNFSKSTVTGRALGDVMTRSFNGVFSLLEKFEPLATAAFQGMLLGALYAEQALLNVEIAFAPYIVALEDSMKSESAFEVAAAAGAIALGALAVAAVSAAAPFIAIGAAITAASLALEQLTKLQKEWDSNSGSQIWTQVKHDVGWDSDKDNQAATNKRQGITSGADYDKLHANDPKPAAKASGADTGAALGDGIVAGMKGKEAAVTAAGGALAKAADKGVRDAAQIKSPSRLMKEKGRYMGAGLEEGLDDSKAGVQASASKNLVPKVQGGSSGGGTVKGGENHYHFDFSGLTNGNSEEIKDLVERAMTEVLWKTTVQLGSPA